MNAFKNNKYFPFNPVYSDMFEKHLFENKFSTNMPAVNIKENVKEFKVEVAAPGLKKEDFKVTAEEGLMTISAEHQIEKEEKEEDYNIREFNYNSFSRSFLLPDNIKDDEINAKYEEGILKLVLPKKEITNKESLKKVIKVL